jgi:hypothetical protein
VNYTGELPASFVWVYLGMAAMTALYTSALLPLFNFLADRWFGHSSAKQYELFH